jgi:peptide/nickel transport system substrate-binding protein
MFGVTRPTQAASTVQRGGTLILGTAQDVVNWDGAATSDNGSLWADLNVYDQLIRLTPDAKGLEPDLAQTWDVQDGGKVIVFHLRHNAKFSDGTPVTAADVKFSYDRLRQPSMVNSWTLTAVQSDTVIDPYTFKVTLKTPWAPFLNDITLWGASILSEKAVKKEGASYGKHPIGSGPFYVAQWLPGQYTLLKRNPYYWERDANGVQYPYLDAVKLEYLPNDNSRMLKLEGGQLDAAVNVPYNLIGSIGAMHGLHADTTPQFGVMAISLNQKFAPFRDIKVRQAMNYAVNRDAMVKAVFLGHAQPALSPIDQGVDFWTGKYGYTYDLAKAKSLMAASSYPHGFKTTLLTISGDSLGGNIAILMQQEFKQIGIDMSIQPLDATTQYATQQKEQYQMAYGYGTSDNLDPNENLTYSIDPVNGGADSAYTHWNDPQVVKIFHQTQTAINTAARAKLYDQLQQLVMERGPFMWLVNPTNSYAYHDNVHGFFIQNTAHWPLWVAWKS